MDIQAATQRLMHFLDASPTAYQAVEAASEIFMKAGFRQLNERKAWRLEPGGCYYVTRNLSTIIAFRVGSGVSKSSGFRIGTAHTDSPSFKLKPATEAVKDGALRVSVEVYGGPIYHTWLDRELSIAGCVAVGSGNGVTRKLFCSNDRVAIIPNAALHLNRDLNKGFAYNPHDHLKAVFSSSSTQTPPFLPKYIAGLLDVDPADVLDYDVHLYDPTPATVTGLDGDLLVSGRLDNLAMCHALIDSLVSASESECTQLSVLFDNEEIGSKTLQGANGAFLRDVMERILIATGNQDRDSLFRTLADSAMVSGDAAHGVHPSYTEKHDEHYKPVINGGPVIKISAGQRYTTTAVSASLFEKVCAEYSVPVQRIIARADLASGGTVGPEVSSRLGIPSLDIGHPIWSMHSIRETGGAGDHGYMIEAVKGFFESTTDWRGGS